MARRFPRPWLVLALGLVLLAGPVAGSWHATGVAGVDPSASPTGQFGADARLDDSLSVVGSTGPVSSGSGERVDTLTAGTSRLVDGEVAHAADRFAAEGWRLPLSLVLVGYSRQAAEEPLSNDVRRRVYEQVASTPGAHIAAIVDRTDIPRSTVRYHLQVLEESALVRGEMVRGKHRYGPADADLPVAAALYDGPTRQVLETVARFGPVSVTGLADKVASAPSTVSYHLDRLADADLVDRQRTDGRTLVRLQPDALSHLEGPPLASQSEGGRAGLPVE